MILAPTSFFADYGCHVRILVEALALQRLGHNVSDIRGTPEQGADDEIDWGKAQQDQRVLIAQRPFEGVLGGMWEFPGGKLHPGEQLAACLQREICEELGVEIVVGPLLGVYQHAYTHFRVTLHAFVCSLSNGEQPQALQVEDLRWANLTELQDYPMGKIDRQIASDLLAPGE